MTDDWHSRLARNLETTPPGAAPDGATLLEIAFGRARSVVVYTLELAIAHRLPATGSIAGDDIWLRLGDARVRFTMNRRDGCVVASRGQGDEVRAAWDAARSAIVELGAHGVPGAAVDLEAMAQSAVDGIVAGWRARPPGARLLSVHPRNRDDEPTKG
jgi:hypothetical protein